MMMMAPSRIRKTTYTRALNGLGIVVLILLAYFSSSIAPLVRGVAANVLHPVTGTEFTLMTRDALISKLEDDERTIREHAVQSQLYSLLSEENARLKELLATAPQSPGITGRVLSRPPRTLYDTLLVDVGRANGAAVGNMVVYQNVALGKIVSVDLSTSVVQLFSSPGMELDVTVGDPKSVVVVTGLGAGAFEFSIPQSVAVPLGSIVLVPGSETLVLGIVKGDSSIPTDVSKIVRMASPVALSDIEFVRVITDVSAP